MSSTATTLNWEQIRTLYILVNEGTISKTAKILDVHPSTISRRIADLEKNTAARLVTKKDGVYVPTRDGQDVYQKSRVMAEQAAWFERYRENSSMEVSGTVRITSIESFVVSCLLPNMLKLREKYPKLNIEFLSSDLNLSFNKREMDVAVRFSKPSLMNVVTKKLGNIGLAIYASKHVKNDWSNYHLQDIDWITYEDDYQFLPEAQWIAKKMKKSDPVLKASDADTLKSAIKAGIGVGVLHCYTGDKEKGLIRISGKRPIVSREAWLMVHSDYRSNPKTCRVMEWITEIFKSEKKSLLVFSKINSG